MQIVKKDANKAKINIKYFVLGGVLGVTFAIIYISIAILIKNVIISVEDIEKNYDIKILGHVNTLDKGKKHKSFIDNKIREWQYKEFRNNNFQNEIAYVCASLAKEGGNEKQILLDSKYSKIDIDIVNEFTKRITGMKYVKDIFTDVDDLHAFCLAETVVLIEKIGYGTHKDLVQKIKKCYDYGVELIGVIVIS